MGEINKGVNKGVVRVEIWEGQTVRARLMMRKQLTCLEWATVKAGVQGQKRKWVEKKEQRAKFRAKKDMETHMYNKLDKDGGKMWIYEMAQGIGRLLQAGRK